MALENVCRNPRAAEGKFCFKKVEQYDLSSRIIRDVEISTC